MRKVPFKFKRSRIAVAVAASKIFPQVDGTRLVVTSVELISERLEMIWKISLASSWEGKT